MGVEDTDVGEQNHVQSGDIKMANRLIQFERGGGAGVVLGGQDGDLVIGESFPASSSTDMYGVATDFSGNVFIADSARNCIYKVTKAGAGSASTGNITLWAGEPGDDGLVNGVGTSARFTTPLGVDCDKSGNLYVADSGNGRIRKVDLRANVTTIAGGFSNPTDVAVAPNGDIIVCDEGNNKIYRVEPHGRKLVIAGAGDNSAGDVSGTVSGVKIKGNEAKFRDPYGVTVNNTGDIFVADAGNYKIKKIDTSGWVTLFSGTTKDNILGDALTAAFIRPAFLSVNRSGEILVIDRVGGKNRLKQVSPNGVVATVGYIPGGETLGVDGALGVAVDQASKVYVVASLGRTQLESSSSSSSSDSSDSSESSSLNSSSSSESTSSSSSSQSVSESSQSVTESSQSSASSASSSSSSSESSSSESSSSQSNSSSESSSNSSQSRSSSSS
jgi:sugar lactone lactonase YvrE